MTNLIRKSFYLYDRQARQLAEYLYQTYRKTGRRTTESEVIREALDRYLRSIQPPQEEGSPSPHPPPPSPL